MRWIHASLLQGRLNTAVLRPLSRIRLKVRKYYYMLLRENQGLRIVLGRNQTAVLQLLRQLVHAIHVLLRRTRQIEDHNVRHPLRQ